MKRERGSYNNYNIYDDVKLLQDKGYLGKEQLLVFGALYNLTSEGTKSLERGLMINTFMKLCQQHHQVFNVNLKRINKIWVHEIIKSLIEANFIEKSGVVQELVHYKIVTRPNYRVTQNALNILKQLYINQGDLNTPGPLGF